MIIEILLVLFVLPISIVILISYWLLKKYGYAKLGRLILKYSFILLAFGFVSILIIDWYSRHYTTEFVLDDRYEVELSIHELEAFLDAPNEFNMDILDLQNGAEFEFDFETDGADFFFLVSEDESIWVKGHGHSSGQNWVLDLRNNTIENALPQNPDRFELKAELVGAYKVVKR